MAAPGGRAGTEQPRRAAARQAARYADRKNTNAALQLVCISGCIPQRVRAMLARPARAAHAAGAHGTSRRKESAEPLRPGGWEAAARRANKRLPKPHSIGAALAPERARSVRTATQGAEGRPAAISRPADYASSRGGCHAREGVQLPCTAAAKTTARSCPPPCCTHRCAQGSEARCASDLASLRGGACCGVGV